MWLILKEKGPRTSDITVSTKATRHLSKSFNFAVEIRAFKFT